MVFSLSIMPKLDPVVTVGSLKLLFVLLYLIIKNIPSTKFKVLHYTQFTFSTFTSALSYLDSSF